MSVKRGLPSLPKCLNLSCLTSNSRGLSATLEGSQFEKFKTFYDFGKNFVHSRPCLAGLSIHSLSVSFQRIDIPRELLLVLGSFGGDLQRPIFIAFHRLQPSLFRHPLTLP